MLQFGVTVGRKCSGWVSGEHREFSLVIKTNTCFSFRGTTETQVQVKEQVRDTDLKFSHSIMFLLAVIYLSSLLIYCVRKYKNASR